MNNLQSFEQQTLGSLVDDSVTIDIEVDTHSCIPESAPHLEHPAVQLKANTETKGDKNVSDDVSNDTNRSTSSCGNFSKQDFPRLALNLSSTPSRVSGEFLRQLGSPPRDKVGWAPGRLLSDGRHSQSVKSVKSVRSLKSTVSFTTYWAKAHEKKHIQHPQKLERFLMFLLAFLLSFNAGYVNSVSISIFSTALSHVSGTTTKIGLDIKHGQWDLLRLHCGLILSFLCGSFICGLIIHNKSAKNVTWAAYTWALCTISFLLFLGEGFHDEYFAKYLVAMAMGLQNGLCTHHSGAVIRTTHVTGIVTDIGMLLGQMLIRTAEMLMLPSPPKLQGVNAGHGPRSPKSARPTRQVSERSVASTERSLAAASARAQANAANRRSVFKLKLLATLFLGFLIGGIVGAYAFLLWDEDALYFPATFMLCIAISLTVYNVVILPWMDDTFREKSLPKNALLKKVISTIFEQPEDNESPLSSPRDCEDSAAVRFQTAGGTPKNLDLEGAENHNSSLQRKGSGVSIESIGL